MSTSSSHVTSSVMTEKPVINPFLFGADLREGMRTTVVCSILSGELPILISWFKDGQDLSRVHPEAETLRMGDYTASLKISNVQRKHSGNYTCKASHANFPHIFSTYTSHMSVSGNVTLLLSEQSLRKLSSWETMHLRGKMMRLWYQWKTLPFSWFKQWVPSGF